VGSCDCSEIFVVNILIIIVIFSNKLIVCLSPHCTAGSHRKHDNVGLFDNNKDSEEPFTSTVYSSKSETQEFLYKLFVAYLRPVSLADLIDSLEPARELFLYNEHLHVRYLKACDEFIYVANNPHIVNDE